MCPKNSPPVLVAMSAFRTVISLTRGWFLVIYTIISLTRGWFLVIYTIISLTRGWFLVIYAIISLTRGWFLVIYTIISLTRGWFLVIYKTLSKKTYTNTFIFATAGWYKLTSQCIDIFFFFKSIPVSLICISYYSADIRVTVVWCSLVGDDCSMAPLTTMGVTT